MIQFCMFGGHEGRLQPDKRVYFTMFGGCELKRPTLARRFLALRERQRDPNHKPRRQFILTLFGGTELKSPTLAEEFLDLRELLAGGALNLDDWDRSMAELARGAESEFITVTLFGAFEESTLPTENIEIDALALQRHVGAIPQQAGEILELGIGLDDAQRHAVLHQAVTAAL